jgi:hypothetical protein
MSDDKQENVKEEGKNGDARTLIHLTEHLSVYSDDKLKILYEEVSKRLNWLKFMSNAYAEKILTDEEKAMRKSHIALMSDIESKKVTEPDDIVARLAEIFPKYAEVFSINVPPAIPKSREEALAKKSQTTDETVDLVDWSSVRTNPAQYVRRLNYIYLHLLQKGTDYGTIPGTQKPTLYKAGAELLAMSLGLRTETSEITETREMFGITMITSSAHTEVFWGETKIGDGYGSCSSAETKYAFRWASESKVPKNYDKEKLYSEEGQYGRRYRVPSSPYEIMDVANTVMKMAIKRSYVDAVLRVTGASRIFTQDLEDLEGVA